MGVKIGYEFPEESLWIACITEHISQAISPFKIPSNALGKNKPPLAVQYERIRKKYIKNGVRLSDRTDIYKTIPNILNPELMSSESNSGHVLNKNNIRDSRLWFVTPHFVGSEYGESKFASLAIDLLGWSDIMVEDVHTFIQEAITLEKKLFDEFKK